VESAVSFKDAEGHRVAAVLATPETQTDRLAVLCHGFLSSKNSTTNKTLTRILNERRIATFRFDFFGQGESEGPFEQITTTTAIRQAMGALDLMAAEGYRRIGLMGSSFGGLVAIHTASRRSDLACLALKCPVVDFAEELRLEFGDEEMASWKTADTIPDIMGGPNRVKLRYDFYEDCLGQIAYDPAKAITVPTLIVQGAKDEFVPLHQSQRLYDTLRSPKRLEMLPEADHQFTKVEDFHCMTTLIADWLTEHLR
jgi:hypothetical protein